ncbi:MAG: DNA polymerase I [Clostridiales Family XIII bacterium]|jgi:DNA polymerase-1|nr:DNA polymerase I [Clostridiales Family XIII bacterium]
MADSGNTLVIIDGNSLINRAYYAIQRPMITSEGIYTQGIYGFLTMLNKIVTDHVPDYICVTFDRKAPTFRHEEYAEYKAGRKGMPLELAMQLPYLKDILAAMNIEMFETDGFEADDLIGTLAAQGEAAGLEPLIISGDRDTLQLVTKKTKVLFTKKGISEFDLFDEDEFKEKYGFPPLQFIDYKGLMGDNSDNIPGLPGVGEKTASKLILEYGTIENLIEKSDTISNQKLREKVEENAQLALMSKRLATIVTNAPIEIDLEKMRYGVADAAKLAPIYRKLEFKSFLKKLEMPDVAGDPKGSPDGSGSFGTQDFLSAADELSAYEDAPAFCTPAFETVVVSSVDQIEEIKVALQDEPYAVIKGFGDNNHRDTPIVYGINIMTTKCHYYISCDSDSKLFVETLRIVGDSNIPLIAHNFQTDVYMYRRILKTLPADVQNTVLYAGYEPNILFDTAVAQYLVDPNGSNESIHALCASYFSVDIPDESTFFQGVQTDLFADTAQRESEYGRKWCCAVLSLKNAIEPKISAMELAELLKKIELPLIEPLADMESEGIKLDKEVLLAVGNILNEGIEALEKDIYEMSGQTFNINSPQQLGNVLFEGMGLPHGKMTQRGYSTSADTLEKLRDENPIIDKILKYRTYAKLNGTYVDGLIPLIGTDGKIHAHFQQTIAATGRLSCTEPNMQNIPIRQEPGREIRRAFIPDNDEYVLLGADYSQIELRILAHFSGDPMLTEDFRLGADIHTRTAARVFGVLDEKDVTPQQRSNAKAVNFGIIYGMSSFGLSEDLKITRKEAERYINDYFAEHQAVKAYLNECVARAKTKGYAVTLMGRRRAIPELTASNYMVRQFGERLAMNTPIQGSAADIIKLAMIGVYKALREKKLSSRVILQVHDELIIHAHKSELEEAQDILKREMENAVKLEVPLVVDLNTGNSWYELK